MNMLALIAFTWIGKAYRFLGLDCSYLMVIGFVGIAVFALRLGFFGRWFGGLRFLFFGLTYYRRNCLKLFAVAKVHQFYAHCVAAGFANFFDAGAHHLAFVRD